VIDLAAGLDEITVPGGHVIEVFHQGEQRELVLCGEALASGTPTAGLLGGFGCFSFHRLSFNIQPSSPQMRAQHLRQ